MNEFDELNDDNFLIYAIKNYQNPSCTGMAELEDDLKRFKYLKRLLNKYQKTAQKQAVEQVEKKWDRIF